MTGLFISIAEKLNLKLRKSPREIDFY
jgi:hypothetical protein